MAGGTLVFNWDVENAAHHPKKNQKIASWTILQMNSNECLMNANECK